MVLDVIALDTIDEALEYARSKLNKLVEKANTIISRLETAKEIAETRKALEEVLRENMGVELQRRSARLDLGGTILLVDPDESELIDEYTRALEVAPRKKETLEKLITLLEKLKEKNVKAGVEILEIGSWPYMVVVKVK